MRKLFLEPFQVFRVCRRINALLHNNVFQLDKQYIPVENEAILSSFREVARMLYVQKSGQVLKGSSYTSFEYVNREI